jgi:hypothetical protein
VDFIRAQIERLKNPGAAKEGKPVDPLDDPESEQSKTFLGTLNRFRSPDAQIKPGSMSGNHARALFPMEHALTVRDTTKDEALRKSGERKAEKATAKGEEAKQTKVVLISKGSTPYGAEVFDKAARDKISNADDYVVAAENYMKALDDYKAGKIEESQLTAAFDNIVTKYQTSANLGVWDKGTQARVADIIGDIGSAYKSDLLSPLANFTGTNIYKKAPLLLAAARKNLDDNLTRHGYRSLGGSPAAGQAGGKIRVRV